MSTAFTATMECCSQLEHARLKASPLYRVLTKYLGTVWETNTEGIELRNCLCGSTLATVVRR